LLDLSWITLTCEYTSNSLNHVLVQIADFGMARDVSDETYYVSSGGKIPAKWTAPEVSA